MMGSECCVRIEVFDNGYTVEIKDPAIVKENDKTYDSKKAMKYRDPWKTFVFKTEKQVTDFLALNLKKAIKRPTTGDDFGTTFDTASTSPMED